MTTTQNSEHADSSTNVPSVDELWEKYKNSDLGTTGFLTELDFDKAYDELTTAYESQIEELKKNSTAIPSQTLAEAYGEVLQKHSDEIAERDKEIRELKQELLNQTSIALTNKSDWQEEVRLRNNAEEDAEQLRSRLNALVEGLEKVNRIVSYANNEFIDANDIDSLITEAKKEA